MIGAKIEYLSHSLHFSEILQDICKNQQRCKLNQFIFFLFTVNNAVSLVACIPPTQTSLFLWTDTHSIIFNISFINVHFSTYFLTSTSL